MIRYREGEIADTEYRMREALDSIINHVEELTQALEQIKALCEVDGKFDPDTSYAGVAKLWNIACQALTSKTQKEDS